MASYHNVNYALRPAKSVERKMIVEVLQMLRSIAPLRVYRYIGFGSTYFTDFSLIHRTLGITNLVSIEQNTHDSRRIAFNRPYKCISLKFGRASSVLSALTWRTKSIVWLDYDSKLDTEVLDDVSTVAQNAAGGSVLIVTVNAHPEPGSTDLLSEFKEMIGSENVPVGVKDNALKVWGLAEQSRNVINTTIKHAVDDRSRALPNRSKLHYQQLFDFHYADGQKMVTTGGLLYYDRQSNTVESIDFSTLSFVVEKGDKPYLIDVPNLTLKEMQHLDRQLPAANPDSLRAANVPKADLKRYAKLYRHFPSFVDAEL